MANSTLKMVFELDNGKNHSLSLSMPKDGITKTEVEAAMQAIIDKEALLVNGAKAIGIKEAFIREVAENTLI